jgi:peptide-methionine (S)-S-oxide reductase
MDRRPPPILATTRVVATAVVALALTTIAQAGPAVAEEAGGSGAHVVAGAAPAASPSPKTAGMQERAGRGPKVARAVFAGGCFWCMEQPFDALDGVVSTTAGYTGGRVESPTYEQVSSGRTGHAEAVEVTFDPERISYEKLLDVYWHNVDPTTPDRQFCDSGSQYRSAIFFVDESQRAAAEKTKRELDASGVLPSAVVTEIVPVGTFYPAEEYHQDYYRKNPIRYAFYRRGCGRDRRLEEIWGEAPAH